MSYYSHRSHCVQLGFNTIDQHKVAHNCEVKTKKDTLFKKIKHLKSVIVMHLHLVPLNLKTLNFIFSSTTMNLRLQ